MTHIHIVEPYHSQAMQHLSQPFYELSRLYRVTTSEEIDPVADLNIHLPWHTLTADVDTGLNIAIYTHCNPGAEAALLEACDRADIVTAMSYQGRRELVNLGVDPRKIHVVYCSPGPFQFRRRTIAVVGFPQPNGRKREHLLLDMAWKYDLSLYEILLVGAGWDEFAKQLASLGVSVNTLQATHDGLQAVYHRSDALLVTGYVEGGPLPLLEALASGCKVFAPRVGYAADLLEPDCIYDDLPDLMDKLNAHFGPSITNARLAQMWTWQDYAAEYALIIGRLLGESVDLYPERGMSRYAQLLDEIDRIRPRRIVEIGTWRGDRALQMIQQAARYHDIERVFYQGFDLFDRQTTGDVRRELSKVGYPQEVVQRRLNATGAGVVLCGGYTRDTIQHLDPDADLYFIDGGHSEETIRLDGKAVLDRLKPGAVAIFDDYYNPGLEGFGCNRFIWSIDTEKFDVSMLTTHTETEDGRIISMIKVERRNDNDADIRVPMYELPRAGNISDVRTGGSTTGFNLSYVSE